jgi:CBS domain-containing protein
MKAQDIMTSDVATVRSETSVRDIAALMMEKHISGAPVVGDDGTIVGIVSEGDLLHRAEVGTERKQEWWFRVFADSDAAAREYAKAHRLAARDVMSRYVISVRDDAELRDVADILDKQRIKRVPVVRDGHLVGIISRRDLVRALSQVQVSKTAAAVDNAVLHERLRDRIKKPVLAQRCLHQRRGKGRRGGAVGSCRFSRSASCIARPRRGDGGREAARG